MRWRWISFLKAHIGSYNRKKNTLRFPNKHLHLKIINVLKQQGSGSRCMFPASLLNQRTSDDMRQLKRTIHSMLLSISAFWLIYHFWHFRFLAFLNSAISGISAFCNFWQHFRFCNFWHIRNFWKFLLAIFSFRLH